MPPDASSIPEEDRVRLSHILEGATLAAAFVAKHERGDLSLESLETLGLVKCLENIGEAAAKLSDSTRVLMPEIPWPKVVAMRHRLVHEYFSIDLDRVWVTATEHMSPLIQAAQRALR